MPLGWDLKQHLLSQIIRRGGWVNAHAHFDRAFTLTRQNFDQTQVHFRKKWALNQHIAKRSSVNQIYSRMAQATEIMLAQGAQAVCTFIDVDSLVRDKAIVAAQKLRHRYGKKLTLKFANQTLEGVLTKKARAWFNVAADFVDIIGGLPSKDKGREADHLDVLLGAAKAKNKLVHVHVDQLNDPAEKETELLVKKTIEHGMQKRVVAIHAISIAAHRKPYRLKLYKRMKAAGIMVIANPTAFLDDPRKETLVPSHNSVTPVDELTAAGITVALGTDNITDLHKPFTGGDLWTELRVLLEACRFYDLEKLVQIATTNGKKVLGIR